MEICGKKCVNCGKFVKRGIEKTKVGCLIVVQAKDDNVLDQAVGSGDGRKQKDSVDILELGQARPNGLAMWEEGGVKYDSQISGMSIWVDEVAISEMETLEEEQILTRVGEWNEDLNFSHAKCEFM